MGYTHYWTFKSPAKGTTKQVEADYQRACKAITKMLIAYNKARPSGAEDRLSGYSAFTTHYAGVKFNGSKDCAHEDFILREHYKLNESFNFCKTAQKPYDVVVVAALTILKYYLKDNISIGSDGCAEDWEPGLLLAKQLTGLKTLTNNRSKQ
jgi:hypothetical protein